LRDAKKGAFSVAMEHRKSGSFDLKGKAMNKHRKRVGWLFSGATSRANLGAVFRFVVRIKHAENNAREALMPRNKWLIVLFVASCLTVGVAFAKIGAASAQEQALHIDIPTKLEKANVVVDMGHLVFNGDAPFALGDINLLATDMRDTSISSSQTSWSGTICRA